MTKSEADFLNDLIAICEDARKFYVGAAAQTEHTCIKETLEEMASVRKSIVENLKFRIIAIGGVVGQNRSFAGMQPQMFGSLKTKLTNRDKMLVAELEEAEDKTLEEFYHILGNKQPAATMALLQKHTKMLREAHIYMQTLKVQLEIVA
ncbi:PA2169 family four-helix-bundle protein [Sneathiella sp.]|uniref:PA2169 family four-helix-bundle protein n=1 Tax=Sneathiella sp. TaxID=1964365 RepID=UPI003562957E